MRTQTQHGSSPIRHSRTFALLLQVSSTRCLFKYTSNTDVLVLMRQLDPSSRMLDLARHTLLIAQMYISVHAAIPNQ